MHGEVPAMLLSDIANGEALGKAGGCVQLPRRSRDGDASRTVGDLAGMALINRPATGAAAATIVPLRSYSLSDMQSLDHGSEQNSVEQGAVQSFLLYVSRMLAMDIGELWTVDVGSSLQMTKLYIEPNFYEQHAHRIVYPDGDPRSNPAAQHRHSRALCRESLASGEPLWLDVSNMQLGPAAAAEKGSGDIGHRAELPLRTAVVIPFTTHPSLQGKPVLAHRQPSGGATSILVLYSQRHLPRPSELAMDTITSFTRAVATQGSMMRMLSQLNMRIDAEPKSTASVSDRLGLTPSSSFPSDLHALERRAGKLSSLTRQGGLTRQAYSVQSLSSMPGASSPPPTPTEAPNAPRPAPAARSTFAQRRMRQMLEQEPGGAALVAATTN